jgi:urocanate hydratase
MVLDGSRKADEILKTAMLFDVMAGVSRRAWARQENSISTVEEYNSLDNNSYITLPNLTDSKFISALVNEKYIKGGK